MASDAEFTTSDPNAEDPHAEETFLVVFSSSNHDAEMEAMTIKGILDASGIPALVVGPHVLPLEFQVQVPGHLLDQALQIIEDARSAGPRAAAEAEAQGEAEALLDGEV